MGSGGGEVIFFGGYFMASVQVARTVGTEGTGLRWYHMDKIRRNQ